MRGDRFGKPEPEPLRYKDGLPVWAEENEPDVLGLNLDVIKRAKAEKRVITIASDPYYVESDDLELYTHEIFSSGPDFHFTSEPIKFLQPIDDYYKAVTERGYVQSPEDAVGYVLRAASTKTKTFDDADFFVVFNTTDQEKLIELHNAIAKKTIELGGFTQELVDWLTSSEYQYFVFHASLARPRPK